MPKSHAFGVVTAPLNSDELRKTFTCWNAIGFPLPCFGTAGTEPVANGTHTTFGTPIGVVRSTTASAPGIPGLRRTLVRAGTNAAMKPELRKANVVLLVRIVGPILGFAVLVRFGPQRRAAPLPQPVLATVWDARDSNAVGPPQRGFGCYFTHIDPLHLYRFYGPRSFPFAGDLAVGRGRWRLLAAAVGVSTLSHMRTPAVSINSRRFVMVYCLVTLATVGPVVTFANSRTSSIAWLAGLFIGCLLPMALLCLKVRRMARDGLFEDVVE